MKLIFQHLFNLFSGFRLKREEESVFGIKTAFRYLWQRDSIFFIFDLFLKQHQDFVSYLLLYLTPAGALKRLRSG